MNKYELINKIIKKYNFKRYLEIGVRRLRDNFNLIDIDYKDGVDPSPHHDDKITYPMTSDEFFKTLTDEDKYDLIFIDGLHLHAQVREEQQVEEYVPGKSWNGTVWRAWVECRCTRDDLEMFVVDTDHGCGVIKRGKQELWPHSWKKCIDYSYLDEYRNDLLNLITIEEFELWIK